MIDLIVVISFLWFLQIFVSVVIAIIGHYDNYEHTFRSKYHFMYWVCVPVIPWLFGLLRALVKVWNDL